MKLISKLFSFLFLLVSLPLGLLLVISGWSGFLYTDSFPLTSLTGLAFPAILLINLLIALLYAIIMRKMPWIPLIAILLTINPILAYSPLSFKSEPKESKDREFCVMSYNIHGLKPIGAELAHEAGDMISDYVANCDADIICLQESDSKRFERKMENDTSFLKRLPFSCHTAGMTVIARWPIIEYHPIDFPESGNSCLYCRLLVGTDTMAIFNCHFQSIGLKQKEIDDYNRMLAHPQDTSGLEGSRSVIRKLAAASVRRASQADMVADLIDVETARYILLCGDFNDTPLSYTHHVMSERLTDAYGKSGTGPGISYHLNRLFFRIDHMFCSSNITPLHCRVDNSIEASDHYPLKARFRMD